MLSQIARLRAKEVQSSIVWNKLELLEIESAITNLFVSIKPVRKTSQKQIEFTILLRKC